MFSYNERREERLNKFYEDSSIISERAYNMILGGTVLEGLVVNLILCSTVKNVYEYIDPLSFLIMYFVLCILGTLIAYKSDNPIISFIGYNMVVVPVGLVVSMAVQAYGGTDSIIVTRAVLFTAIITAAMIGASVVNPEFFSKIGGILFAGLFGLLICGFIAMFISFDDTIISLVAAGLFSLYIGYDFYRSQMYEKTVDNAVDCALDIYLDIINLFLRILRILGRSRRR